MHLENETRSIRQIIEKYRPQLDRFQCFYRDFHRHPELGCQEARTASIVAEHLANLTFTTHRGVGGHGVVGVFENGSGPIVLLRAELDALPVEEKTGLPYESYERQIDADGEEKPVMHACGHDMNMTALMGAATLLRSARDEWRGTLICLFQPDEERGGGARAMVDDGLYDKIPKPDILLAQHVSPGRTGSVSLLSGTVLTAASNLHVRIHGRSAHGSEPQNAVDPIMIAAYVLVRLQAIVSREISPQEAAVVTCGSIRGGDAPNIIPDYADLKLNVRTYTESLHSQILESIKRIITSECEAARTPKPPTIEILSQFPPTINDDGLYATLKDSFSRYFGENSIDAPRPTASEDFPVLANAIGAPYALWMYGGTDAQRYDDALKAGKLAELPVNHSSLFAPAIQPTLTTGIDALAAAALTFLRS